ncbi:hypothetical protein VB712_19150 [Spirulina sp. CCNP1310]|uniref:DUF6883 domain-containing protein n=1 Tax=Spirulina sp. CCNP1310 TaxID=3110249 RepID=UPI002B202F1F|nr:DUF6883 domain-containing protein [Spirulina sp. CCNP1310]MEA5421347.1 hypothetical protein [Spirulina sp. CCNP1310]
MKLPNRDQAIINSNKLVEYVLNVDHDRGGTKAKKLLSYGYHPKQWQRLEWDIRRYHLELDVLQIKETDYGIRYEIQGALMTPIDQPLLIKTIWQIDIGTTIPRFITLFPTR